MFERYDTKEIALIRKAVFKNQPTQEIERRKIQFESKILIVDDSATMRKILKKSFIDFGFETTNILEAPDGEDAIYVLMEHSDISLIITDVNMPKIDGLGLIASIMKNHSYRDVNILLLTSEQGDKIKDDAAHYDVETFIKPFNKDSFFGYLIKKMVD